MTEQNDCDYLRRRLVEEQARAADCPDPKVAGAHRELAGLYADRLAATENRESGK